ncbi:MAG: hypothetical protein WA949_11475 [Phormidesmis sp.]
MVIAYWTAASITCSLVLNEVAKDKDAVMDFETLLFIVAATLLCPITLPCIVTRKIQLLKSC